MQLEHEFQAVPGQQLVANATNAPAPLCLAMFGLAPHLAEAMAMIADILGWSVIVVPSGPAMRPRADLCLGMLPADGITPLPPLVAWSPNNNLNEHISRSGLSILEQPPCIQHLEQLLQIAAELPSRRGRSE